MPTPAPTNYKAQMERLIRERAPQYGVDPDFAAAIAYKESRFNPALINNSGPDKDRGGAHGLFQVTEQTARGELGFTGDRSQLLDPDLNIHLGMNYLAKARAVSKDPMDWARYYNGGPGAVKNRKSGAEDYANDVVNNYYRMKGASPASPMLADNSPRPSSAPKGLQVPPLYLSGKLGVPAPQSPGYPSAGDATSSFVQRVNGTSQTGTYTPPPVNPVPQQQPYNAAPMQIPPIQLSGTPNPYPTTIAPDGSDPSAGPPTIMRNRGMPGAAQADTTTVPNFGASSSAQPKDPTPANPNTALDYSRPPDQQSQQQQGSGMPDQSGLPNFAMTDDDIRKAIGMVRNNGLQTQVPQLTPPSQMNPDLFMQAQQGDAQLGAAQAGLQGLLQPKANAFTMLRGVNLKAPDLTPGFNVLRQQNNAGLTRNQIDVQQGNQMTDFYNQQALANAAGANKDSATALSIAEKNQQANTSIGRFMMGQQKLNSSDEIGLSTTESVLDALDKMDAIRAKYNGTGNGGSLVKYGTGLGPLDKLADMTGVSKVNPQLLQDAQDFEAAKGIVAKESLRLMSPGRTPNQRDQDNYNKTSMPGFDPFETDDTYTNKSQTLRQNLNRKKSVILGNRRLSATPGTGSRPTPPAGRVSPTSDPADIASLKAKLFGGQ